MRKKITISLQEEELRQMDKRAKELNLTRSAYVKSLSFKDICEAYDTKIPNKRRITDFNDDSATNKPT